MTPPSIPRATNMKSAMRELCAFAHTKDKGWAAGLQIVAPRQRDHLVLRAACAYERARPWNDRWPTL
jgi:Asp-tRNA(Asn)/Glu-tRNA(Gln) amidotransferase A subunit family amidase